MVVSTLTMAMTRVLDWWLVVGVLFFPRTYKFLGCKNTVLIQNAHTKIKMVILNRKPRSIMEAFKSSDINNHQICMLLYIFINFTAQNLMLNIYLLSALLIINYL